MAACAASGAFPRNATEESFRRSKDPPQIVVITLRVMAACAARGVFLCDATEEPFAAEKTRRCAAASRGA
jgi:hypothetical protein